MQKIEGNDIASRLAKQRTEEAEGMPELTEAITLLVEKLAIRESWLENGRRGGVTVIQEDICLNTQSQSKKIKEDYRHQGTKDNTQMNTSYCI